MAAEEDLSIPDTGAVFTFGKSRYAADNTPAKFWIRNDPIVELSCGDEHTGVITESGRLFMVGSNDMGQLGLGSIRSITKPSCVKGLKPERAVHVACGRSHTIVACASGTVLVWGHNGDGQLGTNDKEDRHSPQAILTLKKAADFVSAGSAHSAIVTDGILYIWGSNNEGQLGLEVDEQLSPVKLSLPDPVSQVECGYYHTVALTEIGDVYAWGDYEHGKLGLREQQLSNHRRPQQLSFSDRVVRIASGSNHSLFLTESGLVYSCGLGTSGELGQGVGQFESWLPQLVVTVTTSGITDIAAGDNHSAAVNNTGQLITWGCGRHGKLAHGEENFSSQFAPTVVIRLRHISVDLVSCGGCHTMVLGFPQSLPEDSPAEDHNRTERHSVTNSARVRRRMNDGMLPPLKTAGLPPLQRQRLPPVKDTEDAHLLKEEEEDELQKEQDSLNDDSGENSPDEEKLIGLEKREKVEKRGKVEKSEDVEEASVETENKENRIIRFFKNLRKRKAAGAAFEVDKDGQENVDEDKPEECQEDSSPRAAAVFLQPLELPEVPPESLAEAGEYANGFKEEVPGHKQSKTCVIL